MHLVNVVSSDGVAPPLPTYENVFHHKAKKHRFLVNITFGFAQYISFIQDGAQ
jgi:hypothetical protein